MNPSQSKAIKSIIALLLIYQLQRACFLWFNHASFQGVSWVDLSLAFLFGLRFDLSAIIILNAAYLLALAIPFRMQNDKWFQKTCDILFLATNIPALLMNNVDLEYFRFQGKRTTADMFDLFRLGEDMQNTLPQMAKDFWNVILISLLLVGILILIQQKILRINKRHAEIHRSSKANWFFPLLMLPVAFLGARGTLELKPLRISNASAMGNPAIAPLVLNTPFTIIKTFGAPTMELRFSMQDSEAEKIFSRVKRNPSGEPFKPKNVVIIILESFSAEYSGLLSGKPGYTPFLDSLMQQGMYFTNAFANAKKSIDGIPAITSSIPALMPVSFITSPYAANRITSVSGILMSKGYKTAFFHGGNNGTMGFDVFSKSCGHQDYLGRNEYGERDYDGHWGVFDEPFYRYIVQNLNRFSQPFSATVFSLSSHHPYSLPEHLKGKFNKGSLPIHESIGYADFALKGFFEEASKTDWYANTVFVITADHTGPASSPEFGTRSGLFKIPMVYFSPDGSLRGRMENTTQQADILPSLMDLLNYDQTWYDFGTSVFDSTQIGFAVNFTGDTYQIISGENLLQFDGFQTVAFYQLANDPLLQNDLKSKRLPEMFAMERQLKSILIQFQSAMKSNALLRKPD